MFFNLDTLKWDADLLELFNLSKLNLPECKPSSDWFGETDFDGLLKKPITISAMIGDSHAAAFGEGCFNKGMAKATMGTGCSILMNVGNKVRRFDNGMISTVCWSTGDCVQYALEGVIVSCGATIEWLKNELGVFTDSRETEAIAMSIRDNGGVYLITAFSGLGAPHWDMSRKASISGLTFSTGKSHIIRAALESIAYQIKDIIAVMEQDTGVLLDQLMVDGGISANGFIVQFLADLLGKEVINIGMPEVSALGAAYLAGLQQGIYKSLEDLNRLHCGTKSYKPSGDKKTDAYYEGWKRLFSS
jgi:glycerol kinase